MNPIKAVAALLAVAVTLAVAPAFSKPPVTKRANVLYLSEVTIVCHTVDGKVVCQ